MTVTVLVALMAARVLGVTLALLLVAVTVLLDAVGSGPKQLTPKPLAQLSFHVMNSYLQIRVR